MTALEQGNAQAPAAGVVPVEKLDDDKVYVASQWQLMWWRFRKHKMAGVGGVVLIIFYTLAIFCEFFAPYDPLKFDPKLVFVGPQVIRFRDAEGVSHWPPFVYGLKQQVDPISYRRTYVADTTKRYNVKLFAQGDAYKLWGVIPMTTHLFGTEGNAGPLYLFGTDRLGRDMLSRMLYGARISLSIGLIGVFASLILGIMLGGISGYYGGVFDIVAQS